MSDESPAWRPVAALADLPAGGRLLCEVDGQQVMISRAGGELVAVRSVCTHLGKPLDRGRIMAGKIICPFHGACFDLKTGEAESGPAVAPLRVYEVKVVDDAICIRIA